MPPARPVARQRRRRRLLPLVLGAVVLLGLFSTFVSFYTNLLWFRSVGFSSIYLTQLRTRLLLFVLFGVLMAVAVGANIVVAYRTRPPYRTMSLEQQNLERYRVAIEPYLRPLLVGIAVAIGLLAGSSAAGQWRTWLLWRNGQSFGERDAEFGRDVGYFTFTYPFQRFLLGFAFAAVLLSLIAAALTHYLYGGIRLQTPGEKTSPAARVHLSVLLGLFVVLKAAAYWLDRYGLAFSPRGTVTGPSYTDVNALLPAKTILAAIAVLCGLLFFANVARRGWLLPGVALGLLVLCAVLIGGVYPAVVQQFRVKPSEADKEAPYISRMIKATRSAYGLTGVERTDYNARTTAEAGQLRRDAATIPGIRLLDPNVVDRTFEQLQQVKGYYSFPDSLDIDRYRIGGRRQDMIVAVRELNLNGVPPSQRNWINDHLVYTHGFGYVAAPGTKIDPEGVPAFIEKGIPPTGSLGKFEARVYFGEESPSYSVVGAPAGTPPRELDYPDESPSGQQNNTYTGKGGVALDSFTRRVLYAVKFQEKNLLLSDAVNERSRILYQRKPRDRVREVAPFLQLDGDPYPSVIGNRIVWIIDGYTTSSRFPYSESTRLGEATRDVLTTTTNAVQQQPSARVNYIRNSVKATVDAHDGTVRLYQWDPKDPVLRAWMKAFPDTVTSVSQIPDALRAHFRYPEDLFKVQRELLRKYHVSDPQAFYSGQDFWRVPADPTKGSEEDQPPYYLTLQMPGQARPTFSLTTTFVPAAQNRENLAAFMAVSSEPGEDYGRIRVLQLPRSTAVPGPRQVQNTFETEPAIATTLSLLRRGGSDVVFGNLLTLPVGGGLLYVEPVYVQATTGTSYPLLRKVLVSFGDATAFEDTLQRALEVVFGAAVPATPPAEGTPSGP
ncbi:MAG: UPF0182 family protein, partial [Mycobacterium leprae]